MIIKITTKVQQDYRNVWNGFNEELFLRLAPPFPPVKLLRFDGCEKGDRVWIELDFILFKQQWDALITENGTSPEEIYFVDKGIKLPFFLKKWQHRHIIKNLPSGSTITDDVTFESHHPFLSLLIYPVLYLQFVYRKPVYKKIFTKNQGS